MFKRFFIAILLLQCTLIAEQPELPMSDLDLNDITNVEGVNVITGNYSLSIEPFVVSGTDSLTYQLFYSPGVGWRDNFDAEIYLVKNFGLKSIPQYCTYFDIGSVGSLVLQDGGISYRADLNKTKLNYGATNLGTDFSAKSNIRAIHVDIPKIVPGRKIHLHLGDGTTKDFKLVSHLYEYAKFKPVMSLLPSGSEVHYQEDRIFFKKPSGEGVGIFQQNT